MDRRALLAAAMAPPLAAWSAARAEGLGAFDAGGVRSRWRHRAGRLYGRLSAPTLGWLAVGFNDRPTLAGTRFVIASVSQDGRVVGDERVARPPRHVSVAEAGGRPALTNLSGRRTGSGTEIAFSLPNRFDDGVGPDLPPGAAIHLMLAWAHEPDFDHHSAWRGHFDVNL
ncbi:MAG: DOMON domain-containing protein [Pseudomonadota bacterium]